MCNSACTDFGLDNIDEAMVKGKRIIEVGSLNVNGSIRDDILRMKPLVYIGCDIINGLGVDCICDVNNLITVFKPMSFDMVICTEMLEHVEDWRIAIWNMKSILKPNGYILITTRSYGFPLHNFPADYWRFEIDDLKEIFKDFDVIDTASDPFYAGAFIFARKRDVCDDIDMLEIKIYNMIRGERC